MIAIAFIHNLLRRHPSCSVLVNKAATVPSASAASGPSVQAQPTAVPSATHPSIDGDANNNTVCALTNGDIHDSSDANSSAQSIDSSDKEAADVAADTAQAACGPFEETDGGARVQYAVSAGQDVFDEHETDPAKCRAIESSLWELDSLRHHYYHTVSQFWLMCAMVLTASSEHNCFDQLQIANMCSEAKPASARQCCCCCSHLIFEEVFTLHQRLHKPHCSLC